MSEKERDIQMIYDLLSEKNRDILLSTARWAKKEQDFIGQILSEKNFSWKHLYRKSGRENQYFRLTNIKY
ncbi:MAG: hypothetical protein LUE86_09930 [Clostridiales bacterium]|nr:hypothetical protein [Clostridiales bacterium]